MNQKVLQTLEFDKIINILTGYATTELGKLMCANLKPMTEEADILNAQDQTQDALTRIYKRGNVSFFGVSDLSPSLARLKMRGTLGTGELLDIARVLESVKNAVSYGVRMGSHDDSLCTRVGSRDGGIHVGHVVPFDGGADGFHSLDEIVSGHMSFRR